MQLQVLPLLYDTTIMKRIRPCLLLMPKIMYEVNEFHIAPGLEMKEVEDCKHMMLTCHCSNRGLSLTD